MQTAGTVLLAAQTVLFYALAASVVVLTFYGARWLDARRTEAQAVAASLDDDQLRACAALCVRYAEVAPDLVGKSGLYQRKAASELLASTLGITPPMAQAAVDASYHTLVMAGQITQRYPAVLPRYQAASPASDPRRGGEEEEEP